MSNPSVRNATPARGAGTCTLVPRADTSFVRSLICVIVLSCSVCAGAQAGAPCSPAPCMYQNPSVSIAERVRDLVGRMTLDEKISQMVNRAPAIPRLGIPEYNWWNEALHGVARDGYATNFPQSIGLAATWDTGLMRQVAEVISTEARAKYEAAQAHNDHRRHTGLTYWSPNINIFRDPRWGRGMETYGEDPFLTARLAVQFVEGMQGNDPNYLKVVSTPKHFDAYSGPEPDRHRFNAVVSPHDLEDTYAPAFRAAVVEANADSVMCAYNAVNGSPSCSSTLLLQDHLRDAWKFNGYVVSDCDAVADIARGHHAAVDNAHASAMALKAGTDLNCGRAYGSLGDAVKQGLISEADIDRALERLFTARFRLGMFNPPGTAPYQAIPISENNAPAHRQLSLQAARESIVLLKNDGILPLRADTQRNIAVVGPGANMLEVIEGNYNGTPPNPVLPLDGIKKQFGAHASIAFEPGSIFVAGNPSPVPFTVLRPEAGSKLFGLRAEYFDHSDFSGSPKIVRIDPSINFDWNRVSPGEGISVDGFAVRWAGEFAPPAAGQYEFSFRGPKGRYKVYLDDKLILDGGGTASLAFADSTPHPIRIEYVHQPEDTNIDLQWQPPAAPLREAAVQAARSADVTIAFVGLSPNLEGEEMHVDAPGFKGGDRTRIELPDVQEQLLGALLATGRPVIAVLMSGSAIALSPAAQRANAILEAWYPGEEGGAAIAETLAGDNNPAGRLPITFYRSTSDLPPFTDYTMAERTYRYYTGSVLYPFGYGLSYSRFAYRNLHLSTRKLKAGESLEVSAEVKNAGSRAGSEVIELYVTPPDVAGAPRLSMEGFQRVQLNPGESKVVKFQLHPRQLSIVAPNGSRSVQPGAYRLWVGGGQPGFSHDGAAAGFMIAGTTNLPK